VLTTSGTYPWSFVTQIFNNGKPSRGGDRKIYYGYLCMEEIDVSLNNLHNQRIVHFKHKYI